MKTHNRFRDRLAYWLDNVFYSGTGGMIAWLALVSLLIILVAAVILTATGLAPANEQPFTFLEAAWLSMIRTLGGGSIGGRDTAWGYRLLMLSVTFGGIFIISALIGVLTTGLNRKIEELRKGRSRIMESDHIVILGWTEQVFTILNELAHANEEKRRVCVVVLGPQDKVFMEEQIRQRVGKRSGLRVVCRSGNPMEMTDLSLVGLNQARAIVVVTPESENPDADVLKVILAITNHPERRKEPYHIVAAVRSPKNYEVARIVGRDEVEWIRSGDMVARIIAQTCRQSGLSTVYTGLFDFGKDEFYFHPVNGLAGLPFGETLNAFPHDSVVGVRRHSGLPQLNPPKDIILQPGDDLILIARDNSRIHQQPAPAEAVQPDAIRVEAQPEARSEHTLVLGWNWRGHKVLHELDHYVAPGSDVLVVADRQGIEESLRKGCQDLKRQTVCFRHGDTTDRELLEDLGLEHYDHIVLLCYSDRLSLQQADAQTMISLLHLRDLAQTHGYRYSIVSEMLDVRNRKLAAVTRADDFIVSERLVSLLMAQVVESKAVNQVFRDLFNVEGSEIYLKPAELYVEPDCPVNFYTVVEAARRRNEVAVGYRVASQAHNPDATYGVVINPDKTGEVRYCAGDKVIVLAES
jgi:voltage-gated potassium channel Kch